MRHPFWRWTTCLSLGFAGYVHGFESREVTAPKAADSRPATRPMVVGPFRKSPISSAAPSRTSATFRPDAHKTNIASNKLPLPTTPPQNKLASETQADNKADKSVNTQGTTSLREDCAYPRGAKIVTAQFVPGAPPAELSSEESSSEVLLSQVTVTQPPRTNAPPSNEPRAFAEFDRAIPINNRVTPAPAEGTAETKSDDNDDEGNSEYFFPKNIEPRPRQTMPVIVPAEIPVASQVAARPLKPVVNRLKTERSAMAESTATTKSQLAAKTRPQDLAVLVEQVFEDLRQRRLSDARDRTEWLKRTVANSASTSAKPLSEDADPKSLDASSDVSSSASREPKRLNADSNAVPAKASASKPGIETAKPLFE